jgi:hypothetical protein
MLATRYRQLEGYSFATSMRSPSHHRLVLVSGLVALSLALTGCLPDAITPLPGDSLDEDDVAATAPTVPDTPLLQVKVIDDRGEPVAKAKVRFDGATPMVTADDGLASVPWLGEPVEVTAAARGFTPTALVVERRWEQPLELAIEPVILRGRVTNDDGAGLAGVEVSLGGRAVATTPTGRFLLRRAVPGRVVAAKPGWEQKAIEWGGSRDQIELSLDPFMARGLHIGGWVVAEDRWASLLDLADRTEINTMVVDVKDESGMVFHMSDVPVARRIGARRTDYDAAELAKAMDERDIYLVGRVVAFQDPVAAQAIPEMAVMDRATGEPFTKNGQWFLDPTDRAAQQYAIDIAVEACRAGFDEIQFDYVRYPDGYPDSARFDGPTAEEGRVKTITRFLETARKQLHAEGCAVGADIFGFIVSIPDDGGIGQRLEELTTAVDVLSPMVYPSHYSTGWFGHDCPNDHPGSVMSGALDDALDRPLGSAQIRPWIQDFDWTPCGSTDYDVAEVRAQMDAAAARDMGYMVWNAVSLFTERAFRPES